MNAISTAALKEEVIKRVDPIDHFVRLHCNSCDSVITLHKSNAGQPVKCDFCNDFIIVPKQPISQNMAFGCNVVRHVISDSRDKSLFTGWNYKKEALCEVRTFDIHSVRKIDKIFARISKCKKIKDKNIATLYQVGLESDQLYISCEHIQAQSTQSMIDSGTIVDEVQIKNIISSSARGLETIRNNGFYHSNLIPDNIKIREDATVAICNWYESAFIKQPEISIYSAPETRKDNIIDQRSNLFSLGAIWCALLSPAIAAKHLKENSGFSQDDVKILEKDHPYLSKDTIESIKTLLSAKPSDRIEPLDSLVNFIPEPGTSFNLEVKQKKTNFISNIIKFTIAAGTLAGLFYYFFPPLNDEVSHVKIEDNDIQPPVTESSPAVISKPEPLLTPVRPENDHFLITGFLPNPVGYDPGNEQIKITCTELHNDGSLEGLSITMADASFKLHGTLKQGESVIITLDEDSGINLKNSGTAFNLTRGENEVLHKVSYTSNQVTEGNWVEIKLPEIKKD